MHALILIFAVVTVMLVSSQRRRKLTNAWQDTAKKLALQYLKGGRGARHSITGQRQGFSVEIATIRRGAGDSKSTFTRYTVSADPLGLNLFVRQTGLMDRIKTILGTDDVVLGDLEFDGRYTVKGAPEREVRGLLNRETRQQLDQVLRALPSARVLDDRIITERRGTERSSSRMVRTALSMIDLMSVLHERRKVQLEGDANPTPPSHTSKRLNPEPRVAEAAVVAPALIPGVVLAEKLAEPERPKAPVETGPAPAPPSVPASQDREQLEQPEPVPPVPPAPAPSQPAPRPVPSDSIDPNALFETLFVQGKTGSEVEAVFQEKFIERRLEVQATVLRHDTYRFDSHLGRGPGSRVILRLEPPESLKDGRPIELQIALSEDGAATRGSLGKELARLQGVMIGCDPYMRRLFLNQGRVNRLAD